MIGHLGLNVADLSAARRYYHEVLPLVGFEPFLDGPDQIGYRPAHGKPGTYLFRDPSTLKSPGSTTAASGSGCSTWRPWCGRRRTSTSSISGSSARIRGADRSPGFPRVPPPHHATFWLDPFGFKLKRSAITTATVA